MKPCNRMEIVVERPREQHMAKLPFVLDAPGYATIDYAGGRGACGVRRANEPTGTSTNSVVISAYESQEQVEQIVDGIRPVVPQSGGIYLVSGASDTSRTQRSVDLTNVSNSVFRFMKELYACTCVLSMKLKILAMRSHRTHRSRAPIFWLHSQPFVNIGRSQQVIRIFLIIQYRQYGPQIVTTKGETMTILYAVLIVAGLMGLTLWTVSSSRTRPARVPVLIEKLRRLK